MSKKEKRYGRQEPTFEVIGDYDFSYGPAIEEFYSDYKIKLTPYQSHEIEIYGARTIDEDGNEDIAGTSIGLSRCRQTGKSFALRLYAHWEAAIMGKVVLWTAHRFKIAKSSFKFLKSLILDNDNLKDMLNPEGGMHQGNEDLGFSFKSGGQLLFSSRTANGARGDSADLIIYDEAQELDNSQYASINPLVVASIKGGQSIFIGTPPDESSNGTKFSIWHDEVHDNPKNAPMWWMEWGIDYIPAEITDPEIWYLYNPGLGHRITEKSLKNEAVTSTPEKFASEHLGYWSKGMQHKALIPDRLWDGCKVSKEDAAKIQGHVAYAVKFSVDGTSAAVAVCVRPDDKEEQRLVEIVHTYDMAQGLQPIVKFLVENDRAKNSLGVLIDGRSNAALLVNALADAGLKNKNLIIQASTGAYTEACSSFLNAINENKVVHVGAPQLNDAVTQSMKRKVGNLGAWGFQSLSDAIDVSVVDAAALALYMANTSKRIRFSG